jgi:menaquinone-dependent protoporphyrinogen oxidase
VKHVLVTYGSKRGGTAEIATAISVELRGMGYDVSCQPAAEVHSLAAFDAVIIGGALYMRIWHRDARRFVRRHAGALRDKAVWMFSSGPLDDSAKRPIEPVPQVKSLIELVHARTHITFGGRLAANATGFIASRMAKTNAGDWRDWERIESWAQEIGRELTTIPSHTVFIAPPRESRWPLVALCWIVAITAIAGGLAFVARPDGTLLRAPLELLEHTPFSSFLVPGLLLLLIVGGSSAVAGVLEARRHRLAGVVAFGAGISLLVWTAAEMILLRTANWLQFGYLGVAAAILGLATPQVVHDRAHAHG